MARSRVECTGGMAVVAPLPRKAFEQSGVTWVDRRKPPLFCDSRSAVLLSEAKEIKEETYIKEAGKRLYAIAEKRGAFITGNFLIQIHSNHAEEKSVLIREFISLDENTTPAQLDSGPYKRKASVYFYPLQEGIAQERIMTYFNCDEYPQARDIARGFKEWEVKRYGENGVNRGYFIKAVTRMRGSYTHTVVGILRQAEAAAELHNEKG